MRFSDITPNLVVSDLDRSLQFYRDVLGLSVVATVPDAAPFVFAWLQREGVSVFLNTREGIGDDLPQVASRPLGGTNTLFIVVEADTAAAGVDALFAQIEGRAPLLMPLKTQFYGMREFAIEDPDGYVVFVAQRVS